jgi:hypothetical protein
MNLFSPSTLDERIRLIIQRRMRGLAFRGLKENYDKNLAGLSGRFGFHNCLDTTDQW